MEVVNVQKQPIEAPAGYIAAQINQRLNSGKTVAWFVSGGSAISVAVATRARINKNVTKEKLHICLIDERFGPVGHDDSNWKQLLDAGFDTINCSLHPILKRQPSSASAASGYSDEIATLLNEVDYTIGLFGMGKDAHTSGLLPNNPVMHEDTLYAHYEGPDYRRITSTPMLIRRLNGAVLYALGSEKWPALSDFMHDGSIEAVPVRVLKDIKQLTVYSDYKGELV